MADSRQSKGHCLALYVCGGAKRGGKENRDVILWFSFLEATLIWPALNPSLSTHEQESLLLFQIFSSSLSVIVGIAEKGQHGSALLSWEKRYEGKPTAAHTDTDRAEPFVSTDAALDPYIFGGSIVFFSMNSNGFLMTQDCSFQARHSSQSVPATPAASWKAGQKRHWRVCVCLLKSHCKPRAVLLPSAAHRKTSIHRLISRRTLPEEPLQAANKAQP